MRILGVIWLVAELCSRMCVKPLERKAVYSVGPLILVVGTTY